MGNEYERPQPYKLSEFNITIKTKTFIQNYLNFELAPPEARSNLLSQIYPIFQQSYPSISEFAKIVQDYINKPNTLSITLSLFRSSSDNEILGFVIRPLFDIKFSQITTL